MLQAQTMTMQNHESPKHQNRKGGKEAERRGGGRRERSGERRGRGGREREGKSDRNDKRRVLRSQGIYDEKADGVKEEDRNKTCQGGGKKGDEDEQ
ncbi:hypothetical protein EYF80_008133 [Liparis tanakae]|uniref:Uncharacterized protein n=1 Tax=Liparis tanakae TaxID=230148 RepID=A0A4Z2IVB5_9TELE|nr:hypothetical protein EYF80_008133 [Liparis tanakae]